MTFRKQLGFYLTRKFGSTDDKKSWADACGLEYNYFVVIMSGAKKPPSEDKIIEIAKSLDLSDAETETLLALSLKEKAKSPETKGILARALEAMENEGLTLKNMLNRFGVTVSISRNSAKIKVSPAVFADDTDIYGAGDGRLKVSVSCLARNIQFAQSKRIYHNHRICHKAR